MLEGSSGDFPQGTVFLVVVDYGVGTERRAIALETDNGLFFVGPDNGVFTLVLRKVGLKRAVLLENEKYFYKKDPSSTFHGRDIFAPAAAYISLGVNLKDFGREINDLITLPVMEARVESGKVSGEIAYFDGFGNLETNIPGKLLSETGKKLGDTLTVVIDGKEYKAKFVRAFGEVEKGGLLIHEDSSGYIEIAVNMGSAREFLKAEQGKEIEIW